MFGVYPSTAVQESISLELAIGLVTRIESVKRYPKGHRIGYGGTFVVPHDDFPVGVVPIGYHDAIPWQLGASGKGVVLVAGHPAPIIGRISMDSMTIDLSNVPMAAPGLDVLVYGRHLGQEIRPEEVASACDTIAYELLARIGPRVQRIFV
jgi:alanine racemase